MKKIFAGFMLALFCSGCAWFNGVSERNYDRMLSSWIGRGTADLYADWGYPQGSQSISDNTFVETYLKNNKCSNKTIRYHRNFTDKWDVRLSKKFDLEETPAHYNCRTSFIITNGIIMDYSYDGVGCVY